MLLDVNIGKLRFFLDLFVVLFMSGKVVVGGD